MKNQTITSPQSSLISHAWKPTGRYSALLQVAVFALLAVLSFSSTVFAGVERDIGPLDERLTQPRTFIAGDSGQWTTANSQSFTKYDALHFAAALNEGWGGSRFATASGKPLWHPQHVKRLPNKNGRAYFMVAQSNPLGGYIYLLETYPGVLDPVTDVIVQPIGDPAIGKIIWQETFTAVSATEQKWN